MKRKPKTVLLYGRLMAMVCMLTMLLACRPAASTVSPEDAPIAHDFALVNLQGDPVRLSDFEDRWVIVNFWATWCAPCREEMPLLERIAEENQERLVVLGINMRESAMTAAAFVQLQGVTYPILINPDDTTLLAYNVMGLPVTWIIAPDGAVAYARPGAIDETIVQHILGD